MTLFLNFLKTVEVGFPMEACGNYQVLGAGVYHKVLAAVEFTEICTPADSPAKI